jgi:hypothetical protein
LLLVKKEKIAEVVHAERLVSTSTGSFLASLSLREESERHRRSGEIRDPPSLNPYLLLVWGFTKLFG